MILDPLGDNLSKIELIDSMGNDLSIINDAKASFERIATQLDPKGVKLIHYLAKNNHTSPFRGVCFKFRVKTPIYLARQWWKHVVSSNYTEEQLGWNERSFRYVEVDDANEFYIPQTFRQQSTSNKQATVGSLDDVSNSKAVEAYRAQCEQSYHTYSLLLGMGVGREQARGVLVPSAYTSFIWTASLQAVLHFIGLRKGKGAQSEIALYAQAIEQLIKPIVPHAIQAWNEAQET